MLKSFYRCLNRSGDALLELTDAILTAVTVPSPAHLSLTTIHRRSWGSLYAALSKGQIDKEAVRELPAHYPMAHAQRDLTSACAVDVAS